MTLGVIVLAICGIYGLFSVFLPEKLLERKVNRRESLSFDEIYRSHFSKSLFPKSLLATVWNETAADLGLDPQKLRPTDRFGTELAVSSFPLVNLTEILTDKLYLLMRQTQKQGEIRRKIETLGEYTEAVARLKH